MGEAGGRACTSTRTHMSSKQQQAFVDVYAGAGVIEYKKYFSKKSGTNICGRVGLCVVVMGKQLFKQTKLTYRTREEVKRENRYLEIHTHARSG